MEAVLAIWDPEIEWHECKGMPFVNGNGIYKGQEAIVANVLIQLPVILLKPMPPMYGQQKTGR